ncbi:thermostable beta-glucosidase B [Comamonadaceae bacterium OS-1]|nr:thermostable beta-glucosidase B [Comamonadaceae bacterium OS-1]
MGTDEKLQLVRGWGLCGLSLGNQGAGLNGPGFIPGIPRLGIPDLNMTDGGAGIADCSGTDKPFAPRIQPQATALPAPIALAASWDPALAYDYGALLGTQARAQGFSMVLGGSIGLLRDPRLGRNFEYMGEDPVLSGQMVVPKIKGVQDQHVAMSLKHLAANQQETDRDAGNSIVDERSLRELYLLHFEMAVKQAQPASVMCAYNKLNGDWSCENDWLLNKVLKNEWGFKGWVQSDWGATHSTAKAALAGLDEEQFAPKFFGAALKAAIQDGSVPESRLNDMVQRKLNALIATGSLDHPPAITPIDFAAGERLAQTVAAQSAVLLKNRAQLLPLAPTTQRIAVVGLHADTAMLSGGGSSLVLSPGGHLFAVHPDPTKPRCVDQPGPGPDHWCEVWVRSAPLAAIQAKAPNAQVSFADGSDIAAAAALAAQVDVVVVMAHQWASEGFDQPSLSLRGNQDALITAVAAANPRTVVVVQSGNPVLMPWLAPVGAVIQNWYAGIRGAQALADLLFGDANPSGKLPITFPAHLADTPTAGAPLAKGDVHYTEQLEVGYRWYDAHAIAPLFPFGHGLSYTTFAYSGLTLARDGSSVSFTLRNSGSRAGSEVAQVYLGLPSSLGEPPQRLVAWKKVALNAGASQQVTIPIERDRLAYWDTASAGWKVAAGDYRFLVGSSSRDIRLQDATTLP